jgi:DNA-binding FadR family transcriptional regulator
MSEELIRLKKIIAKKNHVKTLITYLDKKKHKVGDEIIGQHLLVEELGETLEATREASFCLECFGYIERVHGKPTKILKDIKPLLEFIK